MDWRTARTCYDHLAGQVAVSIASALERQKRLRVSEGLYELTPLGRSFFQQELGIAADELARQRRAFAPQCLDWTERRPHIGGALGAALLRALLARRWIKPARQSRILQITPLGARELRRRFDLGGR